MQVTHNCILPQLVHLQGCLLECSCSEQLTCAGLTPCLPEKHAPAPRRLARQVGLDGVEVCMRPQQLRQPNSALLQQVLVATGGHALK